MKLTVHHLGPDIRSVGGMASVIRVLTQEHVGADDVDAWATWSSSSHLVSARLSAAAARRLLELPPGDIVHLHLSERGSFVREGLLVALAHRRRITTAVTVHGASFVPFARRHPRIVAGVLTHADLILCLEEDALDLVRRLAPRARSLILANPVASDDHPSQADQTSELVLYAGELSYRKGADVLTRAWRDVAAARPSARCLMVGPAGGYEPSPQERLETRPTIADPAEMRAVMRSARVVTLPSRAEGMPMTLTEAMSLGRPFVATPVGAIPELAQAGGIVVAVDDARALAEHLIELLGNADLARDLGERGRKFCAQTRSVEVIDERLRALYAEAAASNATRA